MMNSPRRLSVTPFSTARGLTTNPATMRHHQQPSAGLHGAGIKRLTLGAEKSASQATSETAIFTQTFLQIDGPEFFDEK